MIKLIKEIWGCCEDYRGLNKIKNFLGAIKYHKVLIHFRYFSKNGYYFFIKYEYGDNQLLPCIILCNSRGMINSNYVTSGIKLEKNVRY